MSLPALHIGELTARIPIIQGGMGIGISLSGLAERSLKKAVSVSFLQHNPVSMNLISEQTRLPLTAGLLHAI